jgi:hypothetical protein
MKRSSVALAVLLVFLGGSWAGWWARARDARELATAIATGVPADVHAWHQWHRGEMGSFFRPCPDGGL